jgi:UDP-glucose 4-epimerase
MNFLITGGAGFLGTALANRLVAENHQVRVLDDLTNGDPVRLHSEVLFTRGSVSDVPRLWTLLQEVDCVVHLAARVSVAESLLYPADYNAVNVGGTVQLMEAIRTVGVQRVVLASSGAVYGPSLGAPVREDDRPHPDSPYAVSKLAAEHYSNCIGMLSGMETVALRIFNAYGPYQPLPASHAPVVPRFLRQALTGGSLVVHHDGRQTRDFVYLDDVVEALVRATTAPGVNGKVINIGSGVETSITGLIDTIERVIGRSADRLHNPARSGGVSHLVADTSRARELLGFRPRVTLAEGIARMLEEDARFHAWHEAAREYAFA